MTAMNVVEDLLLERQLSSLYPLPPALPSVPASPFSKN
jgi:hypothetical protein